MGERRGIEGGRYNCKPIRRRRELQHVQDEER